MAPGGRSRHRDRTTSIIFQKKKKSNRGEGRREREGKRRKGEGETHGPPTSRPWALEGVGCGAPGETILRGLWAVDDIYIYTCISMDRCHHVRLFCCQLVSFGVMKWSIRDRTSKRGFSSSVGHRQAPIAASASRAAPGPRRCCRQFFPHDLCGRVIAQAMQEARLLWTGPQRQDQARARAGPERLCGFFGVHLSRSFPCNSNP